jgi:diketogulonate reductase-like aldo/keto reductase
MMNSVQLPSGVAIPAFGMGTWCLGDQRDRRQEEIAALRLGLDSGATLIDTAEMYGDGRSEELVGEAIEGRRDEVFLVTKVLPDHATRRGTIAACEASLRRLRTDRIDLYLLHWRGQVPMVDTLEGFASLQRAGKILHWGVSNLGTADMHELVAAVGGRHVATNQLLYNLTRRGIEWELLPWLRHRQIPVMAYSPIEQARLLRETKLKKFADANGMTPAQVSLAWLLAKRDVIVIPRTGRAERMRENLGALKHPLSTGQLGELDRLYPPPSGPRALEML